MRYDPIDIWGFLQDELKTGESGEVKLAWYNKLLSGTTKLVSVDLSIIVYEATGSLVDKIPAGLVFFRWDEVSQRYHLRGWVC